MEGHRLRICGRIEVIRIGHLDLHITDTNTVVYHLRVIYIFCTTITIIHLFHAEGTLRQGYLIGFVGVGVILAVQRIIAVVVDGSSQFRQIKMCIELLGIIVEIPFILLNRQVNGFLVKLTSFTLDGSVRRVRAACQPD